MGNVGLLPDSEVRRTPVTSDFIASLPPWMYLCFQYVVLPYVVFPNPGP